MSLLVSLPSDLWILHLYPYLLKFIFPPSTTWTVLLGLDVGFLVYCHLNEKLLIVLGYWALFIRRQLRLLVCILYNNLFSLRRLCLHLFTCLHFSLLCWTIRYCTIFKPILWYLFVFMTYSILPLNSIQ